MQVRVNLERLDVSGTTHPTIGTVATFEVPAGPGVRVDTHGHAGYVATARYDPLLAKVVVPTPRAGLEAVAEATEAALAEFRIDGPATKHRAVARHHGAPVVPGWVVHHGVRRRAPFRTAARRPGRRTGGGGHGGRAIRGRAPRSPLPAPRSRRRGGARRRTGGPRSDEDGARPGPRRCVGRPSAYTPRSVTRSPTQGHRDHRKTDRMLELAELQRMPAVLFAEGGGGRPGRHRHRHRHRHATCGGRATAASACLRRHLVSDAETEHGGSPPVRSRGCSRSRRRKQACRRPRVRW